jgi:hypothetical protein
MDHPEIDRVDRYQKLFGKAKAYEHARDFMIAYLSLMESSLPELAREGLEAAVKYRNRQATSTDLETLRLRYWKYFKEKQNSPSPDTQVVTAAMRLLFPAQDNEEVLDIVGHFLAHANRFIDNSERLGGLLRAYFPY